LSSEFRSDSVLREFMSLCDLFYPLCLATDATA
jgi:hypothetical protein